MRRVCNVVWTGVRLADLLADCESEPQARFVWSSGADHGVFGGIDCDAFVKDLPIARALSDVLIVYEMNGTALRPENGYPARLIVPGFYGTNSVKWLTRLTLAEARSEGPFTTRWYNDAVLDASGKPTGAVSPVWSIAPESLIVSPSPDETAKIRDPVDIWGWSWADGGATAVEVSTDGGSTWAPAALEPATGRAWQRFSFTWRPERTGIHDICSRAYSIDGRQQPLEGSRNAVYRIPITVVADGNG